MVYSEVLPVRFEKFSSFFLSGCIGNNEPREGGGDPVDVIKTLFGGRQPNPPQPIAGGLCPPVEPQPMLMGEVCPPKDARPVEGGPAPRLAPPTAQE